MKTTLEQWRMFKAVIDHGGYAQASEAIHKSQSTISYGVKKLQDQLGVELLIIEGRKAILTNQGKLLLQRAEQLIAQAEGLDKTAAILGQGIEPVVSLALDMIYPQKHLYELLEQFSNAYPDTRIELHEFVMNGGADMLQKGEVDLLITANPPNTQENYFLHRERFIPVSSPEHPLQSFKSLDYEDLINYRQVVIRASSQKQRQDSGWLGSNQRWTVTHGYTSRNIVKQGQAFAWLPESWIVDDLKEQNLKILPMTDDTSRYEDLYLVPSAKVSQGPATQHLMELILSLRESQTPENQTTNP